ncbi:MAG: protecting protein DprA protein [Microgenomates group bacterium GW2011_GWC1_37_8]|uniref:Protecting protein DprA protein n=1 Tax=Candidatus Woesebacteria bacterium GW2011_GWB1_38_8 TaxID=1618570 RepID=A0A0G0L2B4_9BACT|nr:MAG: protecting protein DprA protein [Microgenomates group bacterium GW2011_GWC1_37_8]KKQ85112.1 MAG: protecting protein DprA protein [Candidatus Woesebacteria bacterium GW2011_GWB1_38_8]
MNEREYLAALYSYTYFGPKRVKLLMKYFGSAKSSWNANSDELVNVGLKEAVVKNFNIYKDKFDFRNYFQKLERLGVWYLTINDKQYPRNLMDLEDAPLVLYVKGRIKAQDSNAIAIVGSRKMTSYGKEVASKFSSELATLGITIISGLAFGVDAMAHKACLDVGGRTIAVIPSGIDIMTPASNFYLVKAILQGNGAIVTEYPLGHPPLRTNFAARNRIISGLSKAVVVIEGQKKSGTLLTASSAASQGRTVFAVPGQIASPMSEAPNYLIQNGAKLITNVNDILSELDLQLKVDKEEMDKVMPSDKNEEKLINVLSNEPLHLDELARISGLKVEEISARLTVMELKGLVKNIGNGVYKKV